MRPSSGQLRIDAEAPASTNVADCWNLCSTCWVSLHSAIMRKLPLASSTLNGIGMDLGPGSYSYSPLWL